MRIRPNVGRKATERMFELFYRDGYFDGMKESTASLVDSETWMLMEERCSLFNNWQVDSYSDVSHNVRVDIINAFEQDEGESDDS